MRTLKIQPNNNTTAEVILYSVQVNFKSYGHWKIIFNVHFGNQEKLFTLIATNSEWVDKINDLKADDNTEQLWNEYVDSFEDVKEEVEEWVNELLTEDDN